MYFLEDNRNLGRWLGIVHMVVQYLFYLILIDIADHIAHMTVQPLTDEKLITLGIGRHIVDLDESINLSIGYYMVNGYYEPILM